MATQYTPVHQLPYPQIGDPVRDGAAAIEGIAKKTEEALVNGSFPAATPDVAQLTILANKAVKLVAYQKITGNTGNIADAIVDNFPSVTFLAGRRYKITMDASFITSNNGDLFYVSVQTSSTADAAASLSGLTALNGRTIQCPINNSTTYSGPIVAYYEPGGSNQTLQVKFRVQRVVGAGTMLVVGNTNEYRTYTIEDMGTV